MLDALPDLIGLVIVLAIIAIGSVVLWIAGMITWTFASYLLIRGAALLIMAAIWIMAVAATKAYPRDATGTFGDWSGEPW